MGERSFQHVGVSTHSVAGVAVVVTHAVETKVIGWLVKQNKRKTRRSEDSRSNTHTQNTKSIIEWVVSGVTADTDLKSVVSLFVAGL